MPNLRRRLLRRYSPQLRGLYPHSPAIDRGSLLVTLVDLLSLRQPVDCNPTRGIEVYPGRVEAANKLTLESYAAADHKQGM